ncbi:MAG: B12-binding domain-containing radical SAM protein [Chitinophagales bacterium]|nr:B12-binding domain-containing radical SAM protein [Chitinophagales bacterium]
MRIQNSKVDIIFVQPMDMFSAVPYVKSLGHVSLLRENGYTVQLIDPAPHKLSLKEVVQIIIDSEAKLLVVSAFSSTLPFAYQLTNQVFDQCPELPIVLEGYHVNADPKILNHMQVQYGLRGDSEFALLHLCNALLRHQEFNEYTDGLVVKKKNELIANKHGVLQDVNTLPLPAYEFMAHGKYFSASTNKKLMYLFTTRGCPYDCNFCASAIQRNYRHLTEDNIIHLLKYLINDLKYEWLEFMDLTFTIHKKRIIELCNRIVEENICFEWGCETRVDLIDEEVLIAMKQAGCQKITFGVESGNEQVRYKTGKKITNQQFIDAFRLCKKYDIRTMANFIIGHPGETVEQVEESISFSKKIDPFNVFFTRMVPLPDVYIYSQAVRKGEIESDIWIQYMKGKIGHPVYYTSTIPQKKIEKLYKKALLSYYVSWSTFRKYLPLFNNPKYFFKVIIVFISFTFGKPKFK